jgi:hypothetical protein
MNRIAKVLAEKGIEDLRPSDSQLNSLGIKIHTWNKWVNNKLDPELSQLPKIAEFINCNVCELIAEPEIARV